MPEQEVTEVRGGPILWLVVGVLGLLGLTAAAWLAFGVAAGLATGSVGLLVAAVDGLRG